MIHIYTYIHTYIYIHIYIGILAAASLSSRKLSSSGLRERLCKVPQSPSRSLVTMCGAAGFASGPRPFEGGIHARILATLTNPTRTKLHKKVSSCCFSSCEPKNLRTLEKIELRAFNRADPECARLLLLRLRLSTLFREVNVTGGLEFALTRASCSLLLQNSFGQETPTKSRSGHRSPAASCSGSCLPEPRSQSSPSKGS